jgi:hypothetical protein
LGYGRVNLYNAIRATPFVGNPVINPPASNHNFYLTNCSSSANIPNVGSTITISTRQKTTAPTLSQVSPKLRYYWSTDINISASDILIGEDTSSLGNGIDSELENISYQVPQNPGVWYVLIKANHDGEFPEMTSIDNVCSIQITVVNPSSGGVDLRAFFVNSQITTCGTNTGNQATVRFQNVGSSPITSFTYRWRWETCPTVPSYYNCNNLLTTSGFLVNPLNPMQFSGTYLSNWCITNCGLSSAPFEIISVGSTRNLIVEIMTVNGQSGDSNPSNNIAIIPVTRISCSGASIDELPIEQPIVKIYTITGMEVQQDLNRLVPGAYIIHFIYKDRTEIQKVYMQ